METRDFLEKPPGTPAKKTWFVSHVASAGLEPTPDTAMRYQVIKFWLHSPIYVRPGWNPEDRLCHNTAHIAKQQLILVFSDFLKRWCVLEHGHLSYYLDEEVSCSYRVP